MSLQYTSSQSSISLFEEILTQLTKGEINISVFSEQAMNLCLQCTELPEQYPKVLQGLLDRLEAGAAFSEESCSFSQTEIYKALHTWLEKAKIQLTKKMPN